MLQDAEFSRLTLKKTNNSFRRLCKYVKTQNLSVLFTIDTWLRYQEKNKENLKLKGDKV